MHWIIDVFKKYAVFSGRARRQEFWVFFLFNLIATNVVTFVGRSIDSNIPLIVYTLVIALPLLGLAVRRLHDTDRSGWWFLLTFVPFGVIALIVFYATAGKPEDNEYGPNPKFAAAR
ncbi:Inner membrane protein YhaI [Streptomyces sp. MBT84]|uniref:DUF805 domain-containing protein n=1 Tax=unclassified Streptomyces TaxID=2593676 RepID=UPI001C6EE4D3|nr:DUF805 domain-containing protein [Streptomyces sp. MBT84]MBW8698647.1 Inner membrane protein YhaI [Streptomyces sp. MBT84]